jgi:hypothetical protein
MNNEPRLRDFTVNKPADATMKALVFVGDKLTGREKGLAGFEMGGKTVESQTLLHPSGLLRRCEIMILSRKMEGVPLGSIKPENRKQYASME